MTAGHEAAHMGVTLFPPDTRKASLNHGEASFCNPPRSVTVRIYPFLSLILAVRNFGLPHRLCDMIRKKSSNVVFKQFLDFRFAARQHLRRQLIRVVGRTRAALRDNNDEHDRYTLCNARYAPDTTE